MFPPAGGISIRYLAQESLLFLGFSYLIIVGGTYNGSVLFSLHQINLILGGLAGLAWLGWRISSRRPFPSTPIDVALWAWLAAAAVSTLFSSNPRLSLEYLNSQLVYILAFYLVVDLARSGWPEELWIKTLLLAGLFGIAFGIIQIGLWYRGWFEIGGWEQLVPPATMRVTSSLRHPNIFAAFLNLLIPLGLARLVTTRKPTGRVLLGGWALVGLILIYFTSSRGGWLGTAAALGVLALLLGLDHRRNLLTAWIWIRRRKILLATIPVGLGVSALAAGALLVRQANHPSHPQGNARDYIWIVALDMFQQNPLVGQGPGTYGFSFLERYSIPPDMLLTHAHNYVLNTLAETGLLGTLTLLGLGILIVVSLVRRWRALPSGQRGSFAGMAAGLAGLAIHSQFDTPEIVIVINLIAAVLLGLLMAGIPAQAKIPNITDRLPSAGLTAACLAAGVISGWSFWGYTAFIRGVNAANRSDWPQAAGWMEEAVRRDPGNRYYRFQKGFAYGELALNQDGSLHDPEALSTAIVDFEEGLALEPSYALHYANLAILMRAAGNPAGAQAAMLASVELAPNSPVLQLNLGRIYEENGLAPLALEAYAIARQLEPAWDAAAFFTGSSTWQAALPINGRPRANEDGWLALEQHDYRQAEAIFRSRLGVNAADAYRGLGIALLGQGRHPESNTALMTAAYIDGTPLPARLLLARYYQEMDDLERSAEEYESARKLLRTAAAFGPDRLGDAQYAWYIYRRESIAPDLLPGWLDNYSPSTVPAP